MFGVPFPGCSPAGAACRPGPQRGYPAPELAGLVLPEVHRSLLDLGEVVGRHTAGPVVVPVELKSAHIHFMCVYRLALYRR
jgi:hypothetical protein